MTNLRHVAQRFRPRLVVEGAGVHLHRAFGYHEVPLFDPLLLFDDFRCSERRLFQAGFPWHPHRGIITVTYLLKGSVEHGDSLGNQGVIRAGELQWMVAGSGIIHQEMPEGNEEGLLEGFQLWINLPAAHKMDEPSYRQVTAESIPFHDLPDRMGRVGVISGSYLGHPGAIDPRVVEMGWLDITLSPQAEWGFETQLGQMVSAYGLEGEASLPYRMGNGEVEYRSVLHNRQLFVFENGDQFRVRTGSESVRFFLFTGRPLSEPVAWRGPIVMNRQDELDLAFTELKRGVFVKTKNGCVP